MHCGIKRETFLASSSFNFYDGKPVEYSRLSIVVFTDKEVYINSKASELNTFEVVSNKLPTFG